MLSKNSIYFVLIQILLQTKEKTYTTARILVYSGNANYKNLEIKNSKSNLQRSNKFKLVIIG
jgi:hypothetical protein